MKARTLAAVGLLALSLIPTRAPAQASVGLPDYTGPLSLGPFPSSPVTLGTFNFSLPPGQSIFAAILRGSFGNAAGGASAGSAPAQLFLDGLMVAQCSIGDPCFLNRTRFRYTFSSADFALLQDGTATLTAVQTGPFQMRVGRPVLSVNTPTSVTPEPVSMVLMGTGLAGLAGAARRRKRSRDSEQTA